MIATKKCLWLMDQVRVPDWESESRLPWSWMPVPWFAHRCEEKGARLVFTPRKQGGDCSLLLSIAVMVREWQKESLDSGFKAVRKLDRIQQEKPQACRERLGRAEGARLV